MKPTTKGRSGGKLPYPAYIAACKPKLQCQREKDCRYTISVWDWSHHGKICNSRWKDCHHHLTSLIQKVGVLQLYPAKALDPLTV
ncbi:hypothetical protein J4Q44_G00352660 [Coregonus suidteri]|uniref:Uncharacterized protein n=1 Tax=Coregonus suidteri TaxID=861788 RepID=A0AAN8KSX6_9TELE